MKQHDLDNLARLAAMRADHQRSSLAAMNNQLRQLEGKKAQLLLDDCGEFSEMSALRHGLLQNARAVQLARLNSSIKEAEARRERLRSMAQKAIGREAVLKALNAEIVAAVRQKQRRQMS